MNTALRDALDRLRDVPGVTVCYPAHPDNIVALGEIYDSDVPAEVRQFFEMFDGVEKKSFDGRIYSSGEVVEEIENIKEITHWPIMQKFGVIPLVDLWGGNWWGVCTKPPLASQVMYLSHDDLPDLQFRSLAEAIHAFTDMCMHDTYEELSEAEYRNSYYNDPSRSEQDRLDGMAIIQMATEYTGKGYPASSLRDAVVKIGLTLLSIDDLDTIKRLLESKEFYSVAYRRLAHMKDPRAEQILQEVKRHNKL